MGTRRLIRFFMVCAAGSLTASSTESSEVRISIAAKDNRTTHVPGEPLELVCQVQVEGDKGGCARALRRSTAWWYVCFGQRPPSPVYCRLLDELSGMGTVALAGEATLFEARDRAECGRHVQRFEAWLAYGATRARLPCAPGATLELQVADALAIDGPWQETHRQSQWFASGSCRLLGTVLDGRGVAGPVLNGFSPIGVAGTLYCGTDFVGKLHTSAEHVQLLRLLRAWPHTAEVVPDAWLPHFLHALTLSHTRPHSHPCLVDELVPEKLRDLASRLNETDVMLFEVSSMKSHFVEADGGGRVHIADGSSLEINDGARREWSELLASGSVRTTRQTTAELVADLWALIDLAPAHAAVVLTPHMIRPHAVVAGGPALAAREELAETLAAFAANASAIGRDVLYFDPAFFLGPSDVDHEGLPPDDPRYWVHLTDAAQARLFWALLDLLGHISVDTDSGARRFHYERRRKHPGAPLGSAAGGHRSGGGYAGGAAS